jgi:septal ring factor EnvC (AmiA/AmiB activator)
MTTIGIIITEMALCLLAALLIGLFFGYLYAKVKGKEFYEDKIDALEELCEAKKLEASELKARYGNMEIEIAKLYEQRTRDEKIIENCKVKEEEMLAQLELLADKNDKLEQSLANINTNVPVFNKDEIIQKIDEINKLLTEKREVITEEVQKEIIKEVEELKDEIKNEENSSKIVTFLQNIIKKINS